MLSVLDLMLILSSFVSHLMCHIKYVRINEIQSIRVHFMISDENKNYRVERINCIFFVIKKYV